MNFNTLVNLCENKIDLTNLGDGLPISNMDAKNLNLLYNAIKKYEHSDIFLEYLKTVVKVYRYGSLEAWLRFWLEKTNNRHLADNNNNELVLEFLVMLDARHYGEFSVSPFWQEKVRKAKQAPYLKDDETGLDLTF